MIIVVEGIDGSGKTTLAERLAKLFPCPLFRFPNGSDPLGAPIRAWLAHAWHATEADPYVFQALQVVNRIATLPQLKETPVAIVDRWIPSGFVYGQEDGVSFDWLANVHAPLPHGDVNLLLDLPAEKALARIEARGKKKEVFEDHARLKRVRQGYLGYWKRHCEGPAASRRWRVIDATLDPDVVFGQAIRLIDLAQQVIP